MNEFGDVGDPFSRASAIDEDEDFDLNIGLELVKSDDGKTFKESKVNLVCCFIGKIAIGFASTLTGEKSLSLAKVFQVGNDITIDSGCESKRKPVVTVQYDVEQKIVFLLVDSYGVPKILISEIVDQVEEYLQNSGTMVIFHSDSKASLAKNSALKKGKNQLYFLKSPKFTLEAVHKKHISKLPAPNVISGPTAAFFSYCLRSRKDVLTLLHFHEEEIIDSISFKPFSEFLSHATKDSSNWVQLLNKLNVNLNKSTSIVNSVGQSNLYM